MNERRKDTSPEHRNPTNAKFLTTGQLVKLDQTFAVWVADAKGKRSLLSRNRCRMVFLLLRYTGAKLGEVLAIDDREDVSLTSRNLRLGGRGEDAKPWREVHLPQDVFAELSQMLRDPDYASLRGSLLALDQGYVRRVLYDRATACGLPHALANPNTLRRSRGLELFRAGVPLDAIQRLLGHMTAHSTAAFLNLPRESAPAWEPDCRERKNSPEHTFQTACPCRPSPVRCLRFNPDPNYGGIMATIGTPLTASATRLLLLGSGELGKEVAIEAQRLGIEVIAVDRYPNAPAMQIAHRSHVVSMLDADALRHIIETEQPDFVVPEIEAIATNVLLELEAEGVHIVPTARATRLTMDREGIRRLAAEELGLATSPYRFADTKEAFLAACGEIGFPCVVKPVMSSSGKGQSVAHDAAEAERCWDYAQTAGRAGAGRVIVEGFVDFDYEITLLTVRHIDGTSFCAPIGHRQEKGDYRESWQPHPMGEAALAEAERIAGAITGALGGRGLFGVELFVKGDRVLFSEVSPRPHDTGMVTMISQDLSEFALHVRAILGLPIPAIRQYGPAASRVILGAGESTSPRYVIEPEALAEPDTTIRLFGKPEVHGLRRMGVALALGRDVDEAKRKAIATAAKVRVEV